MSDLTQPPHVPSCVSTGAGVAVPSVGADTPRTDAFLNSYHVAHDAQWIEFGRTLERELAEARAAAVHWEKQTHSWNSMAVELGCLAGVSDNEVPWFDKAKAAINQLRAHLAALKQPANHIGESNEKPTP